MFKIFATVTCLTALASAVIGQADYHDDERQGRGACNGVRISRLCNILQYYYADVIMFLRIAYMYNNTSRWSIAWTIHFYFSFSSDLNNCSDRCCFRMEYAGRSQTFVRRDERPTWDLYGPKRVYRSQRKISGQVFPVRFLLFR